MFEKATELFSWREIKAIYADAIFYISQDVEHAANFSISLDQYLKKVVTLVQDVHKRAAAIRQLKNNMVRNVEIFNRILKKLTVPVENIGFFEKCFQLFSALQKCITDEDHLDLAVKKWIYKIDFMKNMYINAKTNVINVPKIKESLEMAVRLLHRTEADNNDNLSVVEMSKIVSSVMKMKSKLLLDSNLNEFVKYLGKAMNFMKSLGSWIPEFHSHVEKLSNLLDLVLVDLTVKEKSAENNAKQSNVDVKTIEAISEELCSKIDKDLTDVLEQLKKFCDEILSTCDILNK
ncbi:hypothetical protein HHI36_009308 [Cryptolaemus montrouzieri]|uniref:Uncharacterized protein n=1 Tax=Cryptolaemus montrouzieri TaxID=559131 RepID=A0ABD2MVJ5_9CUCU